MLIWSERRGPRLRETAADLATLLWLGLWITLGVRLYSRLAELAGAGRLITDGGTQLMDAGSEVGGVLNNIPVVGQGAALRVSEAFSATALPIIRFGNQIEQALLMVAALLGLVVVALAVIPWLNRYLPWRVDRLRRLNAGARAIRGGELAAWASPREPELEKLLASRALHRLEYDRLLEFTSDPFGDWTAGRLKGLVQAELETIGLSGTARRS
jgi:hypothetical protein